MTKAVMTSVGICRRVFLGCRRSLLESARADFMAVSTMHSRNPTDNPDLLTVRNTDIASEGLHFAHVMPI
jgi:hypothetical protein